MASIVDVVRKQRSHASRYLPLIAFSSAFHPLDLSRNSSVRWAVMLAQSDRTKHKAVRSRKARGVSEKLIAWVSVSSFPLDRRWQYGIWDLLDNGTRKVNRARQNVYDMMWEIDECQ